MNEKRHRLLQVVNAYLMEKEKLRKTILEKRVATKAMTWSLVDLERTVNRLEKGNRLLTRMNQEPLYWSSQTAMSDGRITDKFLKHILPLYLTLAFNIVKAILRYGSR